MSVESMMVRMNTDPNPPPAFAGFLWVSKPQSKRNWERELAAKAVGERVEEAGRLKFKAVKCGWDWRGVVYAGRRSRREAAKESK